MRTWPVSPNPPNRWPVRGRLAGGMVELADELAEALDLIVIDKGFWTIHSGDYAHAENLLACYREAAKGEK